MTTATLRPNETVNAPNSVTGAASAHAATLDDSDASYFTDTAPSGMAEVGTELGFGTVAIGSGSITKQIRVRGRLRDAGGIANAGAGGTFYVGDRFSSVASVNHAGGMLTFETLTGAYAAVTLSQTTIDALRVEYRHTGTGAGSDVAEVYLDLTYVTQPSTTATAVTPDPYTASTTVPIAWTNTLDTDGGAQTRYEIKVFTDAQYLAGGFSADTSTPYYTTGQVVSAATTADVGPLENADTYRAYVRVAQTVNGASHWSPWAFDTFTMNVTTSDVDTVTAVATNASGLITVTVTRVALSEAWEYIEVQRSLDGTTWADVRGATYVDATSDANSFVVVDYGVPNGTAADYRARATYLSGGLPIAGTWVETASTTTWTSDDVWIKDPNDSTKNLIVRLWELPAEEFDVRAGVFQVLGAARPVVVSDARRDSAGTLLVKVDTIADVASLRDLLGSPVLLLHVPATYDIAVEYFAPLRVGRSRVPRPLIRHEWWSLDYVEVDAPADPDAGR